jgi:mannose/fructose/N-acetylgalactosamine-specific phosphotransferase system component IIC
MFRELFPGFAIGVSAIAGLSLMYFFVTGSLGTATLLVLSFAFAAFAVTAALLHWPSDDAIADDPNTDIR